MASPLTQGSTSREATPSSASSHGAAEMISSPSLGGSSQEDMDRFMRRMDMERTMQTLQQRLELASVKATNGWTEMSIGEIEDRLPTPKKRPPLGIQPIATTSQIPYEPPSTNRPWQLIDVLWQPLPPPSRGPSAPSSPIKRTRMEDHLDSPRIANGHRRASSQSLAFVHPESPRAHSPLRNSHKKRSQSHSHHLTTPQDVNAAKALASMCGPSSPLSSAPGAESQPRPRAASTSSPERLRVPQALLRTPSSNTRKRLDDSPQDEAAKGDDESAAELMMFLAHSPSPLKRVASAPKSSNTPARVLFADEARVVHHSNLVSAEPITRDEGKFGSWLD